MTTMTMMTTTTMMIMMMVGDDCDDCDDCDDDDSYGDGRGKDGVEGWHCVVTNKCRRLRDESWRY